MHFASFSQIKKLQIQNTGDMLSVQKNRVKSKIIDVLVV